MDRSALHTLSYGLYLLTAHHEGTDNGCIVDAVMQSATATDTSPICLTVACMRGNLTREYITQTREFTLSVLPQETPQEFFAHFGLKSGRDEPKCSKEALDAAGLDGFKRAPNGLLYWNGAVAWITARVIGAHVLGSHVQFTAEVTDAQKLSEAMPITYAYYREQHKRQESNTQTAKITQFRCKICGHIVEHDGDELPEDFKCPLCGKGPEHFEKI